MSDHVSRGSCEVSCYKSVNRVMIGRYRTQNELPNKVVRISSRQERVRVPVLLARVS